MRLGLWMAACGVAGAAWGGPPLPELRTEASDGGSVFRVKNVSTQPLTGFLIELVGYPGSSYALWQDLPGVEPIAPGSERRIPVANMTVGAAPEYVKLQAAVYADGSSAGIAEKVDQLVARRRTVLETARSLIARLEAAHAAGTANAAVSAAIEQEASQMPAPGRSARGSQAAVNYFAIKDVMQEVAARLKAASVQQTLAYLRAVETRLASSKPTP